MTQEKNTSYEIYKRIKKNVNKEIYEEKTHCTLILDVMADSSRGTMAAFCKAAGISDTTFYKWLHKYEVFKECYRHGCMISLENWDKEGQRGMYCEDFNIEVWKVQGTSRYGVGKTNRVRVHIDAETTPFEQYKQLISQASNGDFSSAELKQLMESINIGCRAYEQFDLQKELDSIRENLKKMESHSAHNIRPIETIKKTN
jgi:hypothetical protein